MLSVQIINNKQIGVIQRIPVQKHPKIHHQKMIHDISVYIVFKYDYMCANNDKYSKIGTIYIVSEFERSGVKNLCHHMIVCGGLSWCFVHTVYEKYFDNEKLQGSLT